MFSFPSVFRKFGKMRIYLAILLCASLALAYAGEARAEDVELYSDKYDDVDIHEILQNDRLRDQYYKCLMDTGPCVTPDAIHFKTHLPEAFATQCKKCTKKQQDGFELISEWYSENRPEEWEALVQKLLDDAKKLNAQS